MNKVKWIIFAAIVVAVFGGLIFFNKQNTATVNYNGDAKQVITEGPIADHTKGSADQKVVLIEYADFQCPACSATYQTVNEIMAKYGDKVTFIFRNYPLTSIHSNALSAATAAEAAGLQGKYFEMYDMLYKTQNAWSSLNSSQRSAVFEGYAQQIGLDIDKYKADLTSKDITTKINRDTSTARTQFSVNGTPTFILNGTTIDSTTGVDAAAFTKLIEEAIAKAYPAQQ